MENNSLQHHGILGQKWGIRRYQNKDGSLTNAGKKRRDRYERAADASQRDADNLRKNGYIKEAEAVQRVADKNRSKSKTAIAGPNNREDHNKAHDKSKNKSVESMSDAELRAKINRLQLEQQYAALSSKDVKTGKDYVDKIVKDSTTVAALTTTVLTIHNNSDKIKKIINDDYNKIKKIITKTRP